MMSRNVRHFFYGFTHAFGSSQGAYSIEKTWNITNRIQMKRKEQRRDSEEKTQHHIKSLYS